MKRVLGRAKDERTTPRMTNGSSDRLDRIERILGEMAARQQYHDEAHERHDAEMKELRELVGEISRNLAIDAENIRRLANIAGAHEQRISDLEGGEPS